MVSPRKRRPTKKWLDEIPPSASYSQAAHIAIEGRTDTVLHFMPLAAERAHKDVEHVHQMRVATRRACTAIAMLPDALPPKRAKRCEKLLRKVRRGSGRARDLDVMIGRLKRRSEEDIDAAGKERLIQELKARRKAGQLRMNKALDLVDQKSLERQFRKLKDKIRWRGAGEEPDWKSATTTMLSRRAASMNEVGHPLEGQRNLPDHIEELHELRIRGKALRYAMEIAVGAFGKPLRELYGFIEQTQRILGIINDHAVAHDFYLAWYDEEPDPLLGETVLAVAAIERSGLEASLLQFPQWWNSQHVGQFWADWQEVVGPLSAAAHQNAQDDASLDDTPVRKKGA